MLASQGTLASEGYTMSNILIKDGHLSWEKYREVSTSGLAVNPSVKHAVKSLPLSPLAQSLPHHLPPLSRCTCGSPHTYIIARRC